MRSWQRYTAVEYAKPAALAEEIAKTSDIPLGKARELLLNAGSRVRGMLGLESSPVALNADRFQFQNFAGLLVLAPGLELEVAPKFLGSTQGWREDFFLLATLSHHGRLLDQEGLKSSSDATSDLATLIGRSLVEMYWRNQRRPLRSYRRLHHKEFAIEGEFEPEDLVNPGEEGFDQQVTAFTRLNPYNAVIGAAAAQLAPVVPDAETRARLERVARHLPRQPAPSRLKDQRLPSRTRGWQPTYDLSLDILRGLGGAYDPKNALAPGFVMQTWQVWEHLVTISVRSALGGKNVSAQSGRVLGKRYTGSNSTDLNVYPDVIATIHSEEGTRQVIIDAKYKGHIERGRLSVSNADIYEALAFARAASIKDVVLAYPCIAAEVSASNKEVGHVAEFSRIDVEGVTIRAIELGVCGISQRGGLKKFCSAICAAI
jgi:5-methylcytosine-specific restriction enzyme subunit McrC|tara:strand:+ start:9421 stop:10710 length:1290 start_codon:yes stop_codon:yes gene_type:complete